MLYANRVTEMDSSPPPIKFFRYKKSRTSKVKPVFLCLLIMQHFCSYDIGVSQERFYHARDEAKHSLRELHVARIDELSKADKGRRAV